MSKDRKSSEVSSVEFNAKTREIGRGSLSILIVAIESGETIPREPVSSKGRCRVAEPPLETRMEL
jgi:hypothetical protein